MASTFQSYAYNCRSLFNLTQSTAEINPSEINTQDTSRAALGGLTLVNSSNQIKNYENQNLEQLYTDLANDPGLHGITNLMEFFTAYFRPFALFNELFRIMSNSAAERKYNIQNLDRIGDPGLKNRSDMQIQVVTGTIIITETVTIHKISHKNTTIESDSPLSVAKCRWVIKCIDGQLIVHLSDTTFKHNHRSAKKAFDHRGIIEKLRHWLKRVFTRTETGIKSTLDTSEKYQYLRVFKAPAGSDAANSSSSLPNPSSL